MRLILVSDTHCRHRFEVPEGDILLHAGGLTGHGSLSDVRRVNRWLEGLPHRHKVVIAGNHDFCFEREPEAARAEITAAHYLQDEALELEGIKIYGSPWQPRFCDWAFNLDRGPALARVWARIPEDTDVLITHGPPAGQGDRTFDGRGVGCADLAERLSIVRPRLHLFGHIHEAFGVTRDEHTTYVNASICDLHYQSVREPVVLDW